MWWMISLIALGLLFLAAVAVTFFLMIALNGFSSLPDALAIIYLASTGGLVLALGLLAGILAKKVSERRSLPLGLAGMLTTTVLLVMIPLLLCGLTFGLLLAFGMI